MSLKRITMWKNTLKVWIFRICPIKMNLKQESYGKGFNQFSTPSLLRESIEKKKKIPLLIYLKSDTKNGSGALNPKLTL